MARRRLLGARELKSESLSAANLQDAQESIAVGSLKLRLTAYLWRDFMPMALADDSAAAREALAAARGMMASVKLVDENGKPLPKSLHAEVCASSRVVISGKPVQLKKAATNPTRRLSAL